MGFQCGRAKEQTGLERSILKSAMYFMSQTCCSAHVVHLFCKGTKEAKGSEKEVKEAQEAKQAKEAQGS